MFRREEDSKSGGGQMLQMQVPIAAMIVVRWRVGKQEMPEPGSHVAIGAIQNGRFVKGVKPDFREVRQVMRRGKNGDIALGEEHPTIDAFRHIFQITDQGGIQLAFQQKLNETARGLFAKLDMNTGDELANLGDRLENERRGNGRGETEGQRRHLFLLKLPREVSNGFS